MGASIAWATGGGPVALALAHGVRHQWKQAHGLTMTHKYGTVGSVKTTMELPDALLRETKAFAARRGLSLRQVIVEALAQKLRVEQATPESKPWLQAFQGIERDQVLRQELLRLRRNIEAEFEQVNPEEWR